ncbi:MAG: restriction endonuclease [Mycobacterium sp.]|nr:MAG: restriction endonuclease [Mycobacterium sp.]
MCHSGVRSVLAGRSHGEIAVQAKFYGGVVGPSAVQEVVAGRAVYDYSEAWVVTNSTFTPAAVTLAKANGVSTPTITAAAIARPRRCRRTS